MGATTISSVVISPLFVPLKEPFVISLGPISSVENMIVQLRTEDGRTGWGECSPYRTINGESVHTCMAVGKEIAQVLKGRDAGDIEGAITAMDALIYGNTSVKSAFDMALYDLAAQAAGMPLYRFLGGEKNKVLQTDMTVSIGEPGKMAADAARFLEEGFPFIKVKLGQSLEADLERIRAIRAVIPESIPLRIDANQGWQNADNAITILKALAPYGIEHCEEPIPRWQFLDLNRVSTESSIPVMADESCGDAHDAERLIRLKAAPMFNIKLGKTGGIFKALEVARLGQEAGIGLQVGGFMESRLGMTAAAHFALANAAIHHVDFDTPLMFTEDPIEGGINYAANGVIEISEEAGLGAVVKKEWLGNLLIC